MSRIRMFILVAGLYVGLFTVGTVAYFSMAAPAGPPDIAMDVNGQSSPISIDSGTVINIHTIASPATSCLDWTGDNTPGSNGTVEFWVAEQPTTPTTYHVQCWAINGSSTADFVVNINSQPPPSSSSSGGPSSSSSSSSGGGPFTVTVTANPSSISSGQSSTISWVMTGTPASCSKSGPSFSGTASQPKGSQSVSPTTTSTYTITCYNHEGSPIPGDSGSATVTVNGGGSSSGSSSGGPPAVIITSYTANPSTISNGASTTLKWTTQNASGCNLSGAVVKNGLAPNSLGYTVGPFSGPANYVINLSCYGAGQGASSSLTVTVTAPPPSGSFTANPTAVANGGSSTLSWNVSNVSSCSASGDWSGAKSTSGSQSTGALSGPKNYSYTLDCVGSGGTFHQTVIVAVGAPQPTATISSNTQSLSYGGSATLSWSSTNATSCTASGDWSGGKATSGSQSTGSLTGPRTYTYLIQCSGPGGTSSKPGVAIAVGAKGAPKPPPPIQPKPTPGQAAVPAAPVESAPVISDTPPPDLSSLIPTTVTTAPQSHHHHLPLWIAFVLSGIPGVIDHFIHVWTWKGN